MKLRNLVDLDLDLFELDQKSLCALIQYLVHASFSMYSMQSSMYPRERYAWIVAPLIVHAQWRLLERINSFGGPMVPQPQHVKTKGVTGKEVACT